MGVPVRAESTPTAGYAGCAQLLETDKRLGGEWRTLRSPSLATGEPLVYDVWVVRDVHT